MGTLGNSFIWLAAAPSALAQQVIETDFLSPIVAPAAAGQRTVGIRLDSGFVKQANALAETTDIDGTPGASWRVRFNLGVARKGTKELISGVAHSLLRRQDGAVIVHGDLEPASRGSFVITLVGDQAVARIYADDGNYVIHPGASKDYEVLVPSDPEEPDELLRMEPATATAAPLPLIEDGSRVDVLIAYTASVRAQYGVEKVRLAAVEAESTMNGAFARSLPGEQPLRIQIVAYVEVADIPKDLVSIRNATSHARKDHKADLVILYHHGQEAPPGAAWLYKGNPATGSKHAYGYVRANRMFSKKMSTVHELGHLFGAGHNPEEGDGSWQTHMRGHKLRVPTQDGGTATFGTHMAYHNNRIPYFSNPNVKYRGVPTGLATRNNADAIRKSRHAIANYQVKQAAPDPQGPLIEIVRPANNARVAANTEINIEARIADSEGVANARLYWERTENELPCPGLAATWSCAASAGHYTWTVKVGREGPRGFRVRAADNGGRTSESARHILLVENRSAESGPLIQVLQPRPDAQLQKKSRIKVAARVADYEGVQTVELLWHRRGSVSRFACPGTNDADWKCARQGDLYEWSIDVGIGERQFYVEAIDRAGNRASSTPQRLTLE